jgi:hypothetical protein
MTTKRALTMDGGRRAQEWSVDVSPSLRGINDTNTWNVCEPTHSASHIARSILKVWGPNYPGPYKENVLWQTKT